ncbi:MAG TPA: RNA polymerase sigma factor [Firmicutes bacterium]|nr:RNA polymerase sigma factor [Bacillota bacterium]
MNSDDLLVKRAVSGDKTACEKLVQKYQAYVFAIILNLTGDSFTAENLAQEVFLQMYISLPRYRFEGFRTWLGRIAARKAIDWKRKQQRIQERERRLADRERLKLQGGHGGIEEKLIRQEEAEKVKDLCRRLPASYQRVISQYYFAGKSYQEIAGEEGVAVKTVETRLYRARKKLQAWWKEEQG